MQKANQYAVKIVRFSKINDLRPIKINFPLKEKVFCPADGAKLQTVCTLFGNKGKQHMRIGACSDCGYIGYIDYPSADWVEKFYRSQWTHPDENDIAREVKRRKHMSKKQIDTDRSLRAVKLERFLKRYSVAKNKQVLEIGCGFGQSLAYFAEKGYQVIGCENSAFRAKVARKVYGLSVRNVPFEDPDFQRRLRQSQFGLIFCHHVLEHVSSPRDIIRRASRLQTKGGYIIVGVPDAGTEPSIMTLLYFPHRSAFTKQSIVSLFNTYAYELVDDFSDQEELYLVGRRVRQQIKFKEKGENYLSHSIGKLTNALGLGRNYPTPFRHMWCYRRLGFDLGGQVIHFELAERLFGAWYRMIAHKLLMLYLYCRYRHFEAYIACVVKNVQFRYSKYSQSPMEIQFEGDITLLTK